MNLALQTSPLSVTPSGPGQSVILSLMTEVVKSQTNHLGHTKSVTVLGVTVSEDICIRIQRTIVDRGLFFSHATSNLD